MIPASDATPGHAQVLQLWFSPSMPVGAFAYSHGLETAIATGEIDSATALEAWLTSVLRGGGPRNDAIVTAAAWRAASPLFDKPLLTELDDLVRAMAAGAERLKETVEQGRSFSAAAHAFAGAPGEEPEANYTLPVAVGVAAAAQDLPLHDTLVAMLQGTLCNLAWIGARLIPLGQREVLALLASLMPAIGEIARDAADARLDDVHSAVPLADLASLLHENLPSRVCRT